MTVTRSRDHCCQTCSGLNFQSALKRHSISNHREDRSAFKLCVCVNVCACVNVCCVLECIRFSLDVAEIFPEHCDTLQPDSNQAKEWGRRGDHRATEEPEAAWLKWGTTTQANGRRGGLHIGAPHMAATWVMSNLSFSFLAKPAVTNLISLPGNKKDRRFFWLPSTFWPCPNHFHVLALSYLWATSAHRELRWIQWFTCLKVNGWGIAETFLSFLKTKVICSPVKPAFSLVYGVYSIAFSLNKPQLHN